MKRLLVTLLLVLASTGPRAELPGIAHWALEQDLETVYKDVYNALEENRFFVVFEPNIGRNLAGFRERWGEDYNRSRLGGIRSMVFCNAWYANQVSNLEPQLLALCPLHITLYRKDDATHVVFVRPTRLAQGSKAESLARELEDDVIKAIRQGLDASVEK